MVKSMEEQMNQHSCFGGGLHVEDEAVQKILHGRPCKESTTQGFYVEGEVPQYHWYLRYVLATLKGYTVVRYPHKVDVPPGPPTESFQQVCLEYPHRRPGAMFGGYPLVVHLGVHRGHLCEYR